MAHQANARNFPVNRGPNWGRDGGRGRGYGQGELNGWGEQAADRRVPSARRNEQRPQGTNPNIFGTAAASPTRNKSVTFVDTENNFDGSKEDPDRGNALPGNMRATASSAGQTYPSQFDPTESGRGAADSPQNQRATAGGKPVDTDIDGSDMRFERSNALPGMKTIASSAGRAHQLSIDPAASGRGAIAPPQNQYVVGGETNYVEGTPERRGNSMHDGMQSNMYSQGYSQSLH